MPTITVVLTTEVRDLPTGVNAAGKLRFHLLRAGVEEQTVDQDETTAIFQNVAAGLITVQAARLDDNGNVFGDVASADYTVTDAGTGPVTAQYDAPVSLAISQS